MLFGCSAYAADGNKPYEIHSADGNKLYELLTSQNEALRAMATGYMKGVLDADEWARYITHDTVQPAAAPKICLPPNLSPQQTLDMMQDFLEKNPSSRNMPGAVLVNLVFVNSFPCPQQPR